MPLYDFECPSCAHLFEALARLDEPVSCPACLKPGAARLMSAPAPSGKSSTLLATARRAAAAEGHFSHYSASDRRKLLR